MNHSTSHPPSTSASAEALNNHSPASSRGYSSHKRNRSLTGPAAGSPGSEVDYDDGDGCENSKKKLGVKRACNDCRQQKLRCNVVQEPFHPCDRCVRLKLECKIESNFKRVGKRNRHAEMERELNELRAKVAKTDYIKPERVSFSDESKHDEYMGSHEAVASLLDLRSGFDGSGSGSRILGGVRLTPTAILEFFENYWLHCHPWLPILDPSKSPEHYFELSELLFWSIICVSARRFPKDAPLLTALCPAMRELIWARIGRVPQGYHIVKAMCLLCTWPLPTSSTSTDPTLMVAGVMMSVAMHFGLHRPSHAQDFSKFRVELREENLVDRVRTWAACNIVAQNVSTGYGQPSLTLYDWTLASDPIKEESFRLTRELETRLEVEKFCDRVTKTLYSNKTDPLGLISDSQRLPAITLLSRELDELTLRIQPEISSLNLLQLRAANLHLRISAFFDSPSHPDYRNDLLSLYFATQSYLEVLLALDPLVRSYATNYILQMTIVAGFTLLKLLNSFFASLIDVDSGRQLFAQTIRVVREISIQTNDLPSRLAEVLSQMWRGSLINDVNAKSRNGTLPIDGSLKLKVRCRMSMSVVFDSVWRWREEYQAQKRVDLDSAVKNPTNPDSATESSASSIVDHMAGTPLGGTAVAPAAAAAAAAAATAVLPSPFGANNVEPNYEVWDPLSWTLDGLVDFFPLQQMTSVDGTAGNGPTMI